MKRILPISLALLCCLAPKTTAQTLSEPMQKALDACVNMSKAMATTATAQLQAANNALKAVGTVDFGDLRLHSGSPLSVAGHFIFDEEFVDSLVQNRKVIEFSSRYAEKRASHRGADRTTKVLLTTKALAAGQSAVWKTVKQGVTEFCLVAEPRGLFTMTIRDAADHVLYAETVRNKAGEAVRKVRLQLPDKPTRVYLEIKNTSGAAASFALLCH